MILRNGYNVYPREVEEVLARHEAVAQCAVFVVPHEEHGQEIVAAIVPKAVATVDAGEVVAYMKERIASYSTRGGSRWSRRCRSGRAARS